MAKLLLFSNGLLVVDLRIQILWGGAEMLKVGSINFIPQIWGCRNCHLCCADVRATDHRVILWKWVSFSVYELAKSNMASIEFAIDYCNSHSHLCPLQDPRADGSTLQHLHIQSPHIFAKCVDFSDWHGCSDFIHLRFEYDGGLCGRGCRLHPLSSDLLYLFHHGCIWAPTQVLVLLT